jgi:hypothetical protein
MPMPKETMVTSLRHLEGLAVEDLILEEDDGVRVADRGLQQAFRISRRERHDHLEARHVGVPGGVIVAVLCADARCCAIGATEHDGAAQLTAGHVERLGRRIDDVVDGLHCEVEGHEFDDGLEAAHGRTHADASKAVLGDRRIDDPARAELGEQPLGDLVRALIFGDLLAHDEHVIIRAHFLGHCLAQRLAHGHRHHLGAGGIFAGCVVSHDMSWRL